MIDDVGHVKRHKPKVIHPLEKPQRAPLPVLDTNEPAFRLPEDVAADDASASAVTVGHHETHKKLKRRFKFSLQALKPSWPPTKQQLIVLGVIVLLLGGGVTYALTHKTAPKVVAQVKIAKVVPKPVVPTTVASTLTGLQVDPSVNQRPVTAVMVENSTDARPQSGLDQAGVIFEAIAEGGITRFLAIYQDTQPNYIGPVRSSRPYYLQWTLGFDAGYAHVGGSPEALQDIKTWNVRDLDQFYNSGAYQRITSRYAPHNVYTSIAELNTLEQSKGYTSSTFSGFARKPDSPSKTPNATSIDMTFSGPDFNTHYDYDASTNSYKRSEGGAAHMELNKDGTQVQITPKVLVALVMPYSLESDGYHSDYQTIGSGAASIFEDGTVVQGTWTKTSNTSQFTFSDSSGHPIKLNAGQTWISALATSLDISYH